MRKFNPSEPFDTVHGYDPLGRVFFQDGVYFNVNQEEVPEGATQAPAVAVEPPVEVAQSPVDTQPEL